MIPWPERTIIFGETERVELKGKEPLVGLFLLNGKSRPDELRPALNDKQINVLCLHGDVAPRTDHLL